MARIVVEAQSKGVSKTEKELKSLGNQGKKTEDQFKSFGKNAAAAVASVDGPLGGISSRISSLTTLLTSGTAAVTAMGVAVAGLSAAAYQGVKSLDAYEVNLKRTEAILRATGNAAGFTAEQLQEQAEQLAFNTLTGVENVQKAQAALLTFNRVSGDVFENAIKLSQDLAESGFGSIEGNAVQLGKALQDPINGISALTRVGVSFNNTQKETIRLAHESGDTFAAQQVVIQALTEQVGGAGAGVASDSLAGKVDTAGQLWDDFTRALAEETGAFDVAKGGVDLLNEALATLTKSLTGGTLEEQLQTLEIRFKSQVSAVEILRKESERLNSVNLDNVKSGYELTELKRQQKNAADDLSAAEARLAQTALDRNGIENTLAERELERREAAAEGAAKQAEIESQSAQARANTEAQRLADQEAKQQEAINNQVAQLQNRYLTEEELIERQIELVNSSTLAEEEKLEVLGRIYDEYYEKRKQEADAVAAAEKAANDAARRAEEQDLRRRSQAFGDFNNDLKATLGEQNTLYKATATVNATIKTYEAANAAYAALAGIPVIGPGLGAAAAGAAISAGLANVAAINSARAQGGQVNRGDNVLVGERGPEIVSMGASGRVIPNSQLQGQPQSTGGNVYITNNTPATVEATQDDDGNTYVKIEDLDSLVGNNLSNPNSESFRGLNSITRQERA